MNLLGTPGIAQTSESKSNPALIPEVKSVMSFGARGDGSTDDTAAFQRALDSVYKAGGGTVYAPPGRYLFRGTLDVPVVPAACNSGLFWGKKTLMIHSGTVKLSYLPPIAPGLPRKEFQAMLERMISEETDRLLEGEAKASH